MGAILLCVALIVVFLATVPADSEPRYDGRPLSDWLSFYRTHFHQTDERATAEHAVRAIGTNAIPWLMGWLRYQRPASFSPPPSRAERIGFWLVDHLPAAVIPRKLQQRREGEGYLFNRAENTVDGFGILGPIAVPAIPELVTIAQSRSRETHLRATCALLKMGESALPAILTIIADTNVLSRWTAVRGLGAFGTNAASAVPVLIACLEDRNLASAAIETLVELKTDPEVMFSLFKKMLQNNDSTVRIFAINAVAKYDDQARSLLPALTNAMKDKHWRVRIDATNAVRRIAPEILTNAPLH